MTRLSEYFLPTEREPPADAEAISHKLMVRAGLIRQVGSGLWSWLPAGWRIHERIVQIVREEMNAIGGQELLMPVLHPAEPWRRTGRYGIDELFKLKDRRGADMVLAMTHEEIVTGHVAAAVRSYRDLPLILYHFQVKERDEPRPRAGVLRTREFIMKDSYTFDRDREGLDVAYDKHVVAYDRMFDRLGLEWYRVEADVGMMGGTGAHEYMAPCAAGENDVALAGGYAANLEVASADAQAVELPACARRARGGADPRDDDDRRRRAGAAGRRRRAAQGVSGDRRRRRDESRRGARRSPRQRGQARARAGRRVPRRRTRTRCRRDSGRRGSSARWGPICRSCSTRRSLRAAMWPAPTRSTCTCAESSRAATSRSIRSTSGPWSTATRSPEPPCGSSRRSRSGTSSSSVSRYSEPLGAKYLDESGKEQLIWMGSYGFGPARSAAAAVEQFADEHGISWPRSMAPFDVEVVTLGQPGSEERELSDRLYGELQELGLQTLYDDRDAGPGEKFADAELLGCPLRITVGRRTLAAGELEVQVRRGMEKRSVPIEGAAQAIEALWRELP